MTSAKEELPKFPEYLPTDDNAYLDFTMKALDWVDKMAEKLQKLFDEINENNHPLGTKSWLHHWHLTKKLILEALKP